MKKPLTSAQFYRWYSNLPLEERIFIYTYIVQRKSMTSVKTSTISPQALYKLINEQEDIRRPTEVEISRLLEIANQIIR